MSPHNAQSAQLLPLAQRCGVNIPNEITAVVRNVSKGSELDRWLDDIMSSDTLLSTDDHELWTRISRRGELDGESRLELVNLTKNDHIHRAIESLNASSQQTTAHTRTLASQKTLLGRSRYIIDDSTRTPVPEHNQKLMSKCQHAHVSNDAKVTTLNDTIRANLATLNQEAKACPLAVSERLKADNRVFEALQQGTSIKSAVVADPDIPTRTRRLAHALQTNRVSSLKDRLDRTYLIALKDQPMHDASEAGAAANIPDLKQDIQTLYTEIEDVVTMTIGHEHMHELQATMARINIKRRAHNNHMLQEARLRIAQMTNQLESLAAQAQRVEAHREALSEASRHLHQTEATLPVTAAHAQRATPGEAMSHTIDRTGVAADMFPAPSPAKMPAQAIISTRETLQSAASHRGEAVLLLRALEGATNVRSLDDLDQRIAATSRQFDRIVKQAG